MVQNLSACRPHGIRRVFACLRGCLAVIVAAYRDDGGAAALAGRAHASPSWNTVSCAASAGIMSCTSSISSDLKSKRTRVRREARVALAKAAKPHSAATARGNSALRT